MPITNYANGVSSFGVPIFPNGLPAVTGNVFWVDSGFGSNGDGSFDKPCSTVANAITLTVAGNDDMIVMKEGHTESITAAGTWTPKAQSTIVGLGFGTRKPLITWDTAISATCLVSAANVTLINFDCTSGIAELDVCISVTAASCSILGVNYRETSTSYMVETFILTAAGADKLTVKGCRIVQVTAPTANAFCIKLVGADDCLIQDNVIFWNSTNNAGSGAFGVVGTECLRMQIIGNFITMMAGSSILPILTITSCTGLIANNRLVGPATTPITAVGVGCAENYSGAATKGGTLSPAA